MLAKRGLRMLPKLRELGPVTLARETPSLAVIVPARNEAGAVGACVQSLLDQHYGNLLIIAVDDRSTDATGAILDELSVEHPERLKVLHITSLPEGWLGKTHAMAVAARHARAAFEPEWLLFTDGDVLFDPECLRRTLALAVEQGADHFVTLPTAILHTAGENIIMGFLQVLGLWGVRLWRVSDPKARDAIGVGAFNLLRSTAYEQIGGFARLRLQVLEDLALGHLIKSQGFRQGVALAQGYVRVHWAPGITGVLHTMTKNLFAVFQFRVALLLLACCGVAVVCLGPVAGLFWASTRLPSSIALLAILALYWIAARHLTPIPIVSALAFPLGAILMLYALLRSAGVTLRDGGVRWRGTFYPLAELRRHAAKLH